ncbi:uncharacterized protein LY89DRAFT_696453 [Mollisia scopiformis]|uniref:SET domain-containing protein n=1 Tax=Mollisia scopiformis TaxID=149040 RepID=A0A194XCW2_MOLSC|nr:uncharacterized protein LY89DRAFT_696453 [Mollisia scopiformis]KUJ17999.1 hypothetical protein LY89DRAFT_696453 [Mollisia scopiformis]
MGIDAGFDMYPREHPKLPFEGHKFLRFSSKVSGSTAADTKVDSYIDTVTRIAQTCFGSRIKCWHEGADQIGAYDWVEVHESLMSYQQMNLRLRPVLPSFLVAPILSQSWALRLSRSSTSSEKKPLLTVGPMPPDELERFLATKLKAMSRESQRQFLSLHNNFQAKNPFSGIFKTNALPCGSGSPVGSVYPTVCLINHSCMPNAHNNWNSAKEHETIHAIRSIERGAEITISYDHGGTSSERQAFLKESFGFSCTFLDQEFDACAGALVARLYYDAFQISIAHGDQARASIFADRAYQARVICEGEDSPETLRVKSLALKPAVHSSFEAYSRKWKSARDSVPKALDTVDFDKWLFRQEN